MKRISIGETNLHVLIAGSGPTLLLVHGFPLDHTMWQRQIDDLSASFQIIAPDLRGFGQSDPVSGTVKMERFADDLAELLSTLDINEPVNFCGLSMGGYVAWQFWMRHKQRLNRLILCDTRAIADTEDTAKFRLETAEKVVADGPVALANSMSDKLFCKQTLQNNQEIVEQTRQVMLRTAPESIAAALRGMARREDFTGHLKGIDIPSLVICGAEDAISPSEEMRRIAEGLPIARYVEIPSAGHMSPLENPSAVNQAIREFVSEA